MLSRCFAWLCAAAARSCACLARPAGGLALPAAGRRRDPRAQRSGALGKPVPGVSPAAMQMARHVAREMETTNRYAEKLIHNCLKRVREIYFGITAVNWAIAHGAPDGAAFFESASLRFSTRWRDQAPLPGFRRFGGDALRSKATADTLRQIDGELRRLEGPLRDRAVG